MKPVRFLAAFIVGLIWASGAAFAACSGGTCFWIGGTGTLNGSSDSAHWATSSGGTTCSCEPATTDNWTFDGSSGGGTVTMSAGPFTLGTLTMGAFTGTLTAATNNPSLTMTALSITGTGTRTLSMGSGTWTLNGTSGTPLDCTTTSNLTLTPGTSTLLVSATATGVRFVAGCGTVNAFNTVTFASGAAQYSIDISTNLGAATFNMTAPVFVRLQSGITLQITNAFTWTGSSTNKIVLMSGTNGTAVTVHATGGGSGSWIAIKDITFNTGSVSLTTCFDLKNNTFSGGGSCAAPVLGTINAGGIIGG
jgi:hypothetical protein